MKIAIGNDHLAVGLKNEIMEHLRTSKINEITVEDMGTASLISADVDYPVYAERVAAAVANGEYDLGILLCGTGVGMSLAANKIQGIRAVVCSEPYTAKMSREHNNTNILCMGARVVGNELAKMIVDAWLTAEFEGGRHQRRIDMIMDLERRTRT